MGSVLDFENSDAMNDKNKLAFGLIASSNNRRVIVADDKDDDILDYLQERLDKANEESQKYTI